MTPFTPSLPARKENTNPPRRASDPALAGASSAFERPECVGVTAGETAFIDSRRPPALTRGRRIDDAAAAVAQQIIRGWCHTAGSTRPASSFLSPSPLKWREQTC